ncbi:MAG: hypothetical protein KF830_01910 [Planctomycetes bacterium]|nr:hypothetical protein [Planctomycetota bacterium]
MTRSTLAQLFSLAAMIVFAGCSGGGSDTGDVRTGGDFVVLRTEPSDNARLYLNEPISIDFSFPVDLGSVDLSTFSFTVLDQLGNVVAEPPAGSFALAVSPGDASPGRRLQFIPRLPTNDTYTNGGFRPGRTYIVQLVGGDRVNGTVLRDQRGKALKQPITFRFQTADGTSLDQLFRNTVAGGPRRVSLTITPTPVQIPPGEPRVVLNKLGLAPVEIRLGFDQPLNPSSTNVPIALDTDPLVRDANNRGRIYLEYDDPDPAFGANRWIPADIDLEANTYTGATVLLRPLGILPNNATVRIVVDRTLEDIAGESNTANAAYEPVFGTFRTSSSYEQQFDALVEDFLVADSIDPAAPFAEPVADVGPGYVKAGFAFEGTTTTIEFDPQPNETILNTNFTQVVPKQGSPYNVSGGVFNFKNVRIGAGKTVRGQGSNPMVWLVSEKFEVFGTLSVRGGDGTRVESVGNADVPKDGGIGVCGGGDGGAGSPSATLRDAAGGTGRGPLQATGQGGTGGLLSCRAGCNRGSGGGGGSLATQGDPNYKQKVAAVGTFPAGTPTNVQPVFQQQTGLGGLGCIGAAGAVTRDVNGGTAGPVAFVDARNDNNFWGSGIDFNRRLRITGELSVPVGGGGGGGGGDLSYNASCTIEGEANFLNDSSGGGGGGGGGVLIVKALGPIVIGDSSGNGRITADGGNGGGGEPSASCGRGGGGGGGSGGMVILMSATRIEINVRGGNYAQNNYDFSVSADGGVCRTGTGTPVVTGKYPANGVAITTTFMTTYDSAPLGGFGGMGIVQLMAPPGLNADGTNTVLDDNIRVLQGGAELSGAAKQAALAWRGIQGPTGFRDDFNNVVSIGDNEGDIRPSPILLPSPFGPRTRLRSKWLDTGASARRPLLADDNTPRGIVVSGGDVPGPWYEFGAVNPVTGFANFAVSGGRGLVDYGGPVIAETPIADVNPDFSHLGKPAYRIVLDQPAMGSVADRYVHYEAEILNAANAQVGSFRILQHTSQVLLLSPEGGAFPAFPAVAKKLRVRAKFFQVVTGGAEGLGSTYVGTGGGLVPTANVRIGFAFHSNPKDAGAPRFPATAGTFTYNLADPAVQEQIRALGLTFVQWDITFDGTFQNAPSDAPPAFGPTTPRPELHWVRLPFRF